MYIIYIYIYIYRYIYMSLTLKGEIIRKIPKRYPILSHANLRHFIVDVHLVRFVPRLHRGGKLFIGMQELTRSFSIFSMYGVAKAYKC